MELDGLWSRRRRIPVFLLLGVTSFSLQSLVAVSLNDEGKALLRFKERIENDPFGALLSWKESSLENHPCSWYGVDCVDGHVVSLKLKDLCLAGTLAPQLAHLVHIKLIALRNNSLWGAVPEELAGLEELEVLDLGFNNFSGPLNHEWGNNVAVLLLDNNGQFCHVPPEVEQLTMISEVQVDESDLSPIIQDSSYKVKFRSSCVAEHAKALLSHAFLRCDHQIKDTMHRRELQDLGFGPKDSSEAPPPKNMILPPGPLEAAPPPAPPAPRHPKDPPPPGPPPPSDLETPPPSPTSPVANPTESPSPSGGTNIPIIAIAASVGGFLLLALIIGLFIWRRKKIATVGPWRTGMSGRLQTRSPVNGNESCFQ